VLTTAVQHLDFIAQFTTNIRNISGQKNVVAGALSRVESVTAPPSFDALATAQTSNDVLQTLLQSNTALRLEKQHISGTTVSIYCDTSAGKPRPYIPAPLRLQMFESVHNLSHPGTKITAKLIAQRFVWPGVQKDCRTWARACQAYQRSKVYRYTHRNASNISWSHILSHCNRPLHTMARSDPHSRHHSRNRGKRPPDRLDIPFRLPVDNRHRSGTSVWVPTLPLPGQIMWYPTFWHDCLSPCTQRTRGKIPPDDEDSHHVPRQPKLDRRTSPLPLGHPHIYLKRICKRQ
jgi:hypothetical protein